MFRQNAPKLDFAFMAKTANFKDVRNMIFVVFQQQRQDNLEKVSLALNWRYPQHLESD
jgi:hypothetical protein